MSSVGYPPQPPPPLPADASFADREAFRVRAGLAAAMTGVKAAPPPPMPTGDAAPRKKGGGGGCGG